MSHKLLFAILVMALLQVATEDAEGAATPKLSFSGFGTLGMVHSSEGQADFVANMFKPSGAGHTRRWSPDVDSVIGAQLNGYLTPRLSAIVQVIAEQNYDKTYRPHIEWANLRYALNEDADVRAGRIVLPIFMYSEYRKANYALPWIRPPVEVYNLVPISANDGIDASYRIRFGEAANVIRAFYGGKTSRHPDGSEAEARDQWGLFDTIEYGALTLQLHYHQTDLDLEGPRPLFEAFRAFGAQGASIADRYDCNGRRVGTGGFGADYDPGGWFLRGEWAKAFSSCFIRPQTAWYLSGGYRLHNVMPYFVYAKVRMAGNTSDPGLNPSSVPPSAAGAAAALNAALNGILSSSARSTISLGARWDFMPHANLKVQYDLIDLNHRSTGGLTNIQPGFQRGDRVNLFSVAVDFVF